MQPRRVRVATRDAVRARERIRQWAMGISHGPKPDSWARWPRQPSREPAEAEADAVTKPVRERAKQEIAGEAVVSRSGQSDLRHQRERNQAISTTHGNGTRATALAIRGTAGACRLSGDPAGDRERSRKGDLERDRPQRNPVHARQPA